MIRYDRVLILGDFNIHVCCPSHSLTSHFLDLTESFDLTQSVTGATHSKGHNLDLVLSFGLSLEDLNLVDMLVTDHKAIVSKVSLQLLFRSPYPATCSHTLNDSSAAKFLHFPVSPLNLDLLLRSFNDQCLSSAKLLHTKPGKISQKTFPG